MKLSAIINAGAFAVLLLFSSKSAVSQVHPYTIVGTGVVRCYNNTAVIPCPVNPSDPFYGQNQGLTPAYQDNGNGTINDLNTGLMWIQARGLKTTWDSAFIKAAQCTTGGFTDWRVPTIKELYSLIIFTGKSGLTASQCIPYIDTAYFGWAAGNTAIGERVIDAQDWSATKYKGLTMVGDTTVFGVNFVDGRIKGYPEYVPGPGSTAKQKMHIRFVRGNPNYGVNAFMDNGNGTITDNATGRMWTKNDNGTAVNWQAALAYTQTSNTAGFLGHNDWRLPTAKELQSIVDYTRSKDFTNSPAIDPVFSCTQIVDEGGNQNWPFYWTNTTHLDNMGGVYVSFGEALGWMHFPPTASYYTLADVHGAGAQRSDPKAGNPTNYFLGYDQQGNPVYGLGPQGDVIRINNYVRLVRDETASAVIENQNKSQLMVSPDPVDDICTISLNNKFFRVKTEIFNLTGKKVKSLEFDGKSKTDINLGDLLPGLYFLSVNADGQIFSVKIVKR